VRLHTRSIHGARAVFGADNMNLVTSALISEGGMIPSQDRVLPGCSRNLPFLAVTDPATNMRGPNLSILMPHGRLSD
jgi:hypothetical protein